MQRGEGTADQQLPVSLQGAGNDSAVGIGIVRGIDRSIGIETNDAIAHRRGGRGRSLHRSKGAHRDRFAIGLNHDGAHAGVDVHRIRRVERAVGIDPGKEAAADLRRRGRGARAGSESIELTAEKDLVVGLERESADAAVGRRIESGIQRTIRVQAEQV